MRPDNARAPLYSIKILLREFIPRPTKFPGTHAAQKAHQLCMETSFLTLACYSFGLIPWTQLRGGMEIRGNL
jgi:hypothetical protein